MKWCGNCDHEPRIITGVSDGRRDGIVDSDDAESRVHDGRARAFAGRDQDWTPHSRAAGRPAKLPSPKVRAIAERVNSDERNSQTVSTRGWEVDIRVVLPDDSEHRERRKAPVTGQSRGQRWGRSSGARFAASTARLKPARKKEVPTLSRSSRRGFWRGTREPTNTRRAAFTPRI